MKKLDSDSDNDTRKNPGFNYYIEQLHRISIEQKSSQMDEVSDDDLLDFFVQLLRLITQSGDAFLDKFLSEAQSNLGADSNKTWPALQRMQTAGLVDINEGRVTLTASGKELMHEM